jgi:hypothetical protein
MRGCETTKAKYRLRYREQGTPDSRGGVLREHFAHDLVELVLYLSQLFVETDLRESRTIRGIAVDESPTLSLTASFSASAFPVSVSIGRAAEDVYYRAKDKFSNNTS